jgi:ABC-type iron transport system FetAB permease component
MTFADLLDLGLALVLVIVAIALATFLGLRMKGDSHRSGRRERR